MILDLHMLELAQEAYDAPPDVTAGDCFVILRHAGDVTVVSFAGTNPRQLRDVLTDCDAVTTFHPQIGEVHAGFLRDVEGVFDAILQRVGDDRIAVTGHSKGGSEASIFAALCLAAGRPIAQLTTFGRARCGDLNGWIKDLPGDDWWNGDDPIPDLPPWLPHPRTMTRVGFRAWKFDPIEDHMLTAYHPAVAAAVQALAGRRSSAA
jgi:hypothetical protein